jgi:hypothetical protein
MLRYSCEVRGDDLTPLFLRPKIMNDGEHDFCELRGDGVLGSTRSPGLLSPLLRPGPGSRGTAGLRVAER